MFFIYSGLAAAGLVALAGPFGPLRDLRNPLLLAAVAYLALAAVEKSWPAKAAIARALEHRYFPWALTGIAALVFSRIKLLEWWGGAISGVDFSHLDYAIWSTAHGRFMDIPIIPPQPTLLDAFGSHYSPILLVPVAVRMVFDTPVSSLLVHALSLAAAVPVLHALATKLVDRLSASLLTMVYIFCGATASALQFDIHQESFFPLGLALVFLGLYSHLGWALLGTVITLAVKEDAGLYLAPLFFWMAILYPRRRGPAILLGLASLVWLGFVLKVAMRWHQPPVMEAASFYFSLWQKYGDSYGAAVLGMLKHPHWVAADIFLNPALYKNLLAWGFLPLASPLGLIALPPIAIMATATGSPVVRSFGLYYGIVLVPIFFVATAHTLARFRSLPRRRGMAWMLLALAAFVGGSFLRFPKPSPEFAAWRSVGAQIEAKLGEEPAIWVQSGFLPYLPYGTRWRRIDTFSTLPPAGKGPLVFYRSLKGDSIEFPWEQFEARLGEKGYRKILDDGPLAIYR